MSSNNSVALVFILAQFRRPLLRKVQLQRTNPIKTGIEFQTDETRRTQFCDICIFESEVKSEVRLNTSGC